MYLPSAVPLTDHLQAPKELALLATALLLVAALTLRHSKWFLDTVDVVLALYLAVSIASAIFVAVNPWLAWRALGISTAAACIFWSTRHLASAGLRAQIIVVMILVAGCLTVSCIAEAYGIGPRLSAAGRAPGGLMANRNRAAHLLVTGLPLIYFCMMTARRAASVGVMSASAAAAAAVIILSRSRGAWISGFVVVVALLLASSMLLNRDRRCQVRTTAFIISLIIGVSFAVAIPSNLAWRRSYKDSLVRIVDITEGSGRGRLVDARNTVRMILHYPVLGVGPGNWPVQYPRFTTADDASYEPRARHPIDRIPLSDWIGITAERGIIATALLGLFGILLFRLLFLAMRASTDRDSRLRAAVALAFASGVVITGSIDPFILTAPGALWVFAALGALAPRAASERRELHENGRLAGIAMVLVLLLVPLIQGFAALYASHLLVSPSLERIERVAAVDRGNYDAWLLLGTLWAHRGNCEAAAPPLREAVRLFPSWRNR